MTGALIMVGFVALIHSINDGLNDKSQPGKAILQGCVVVVGAGSIGWAAEAAIRAAVGAVL